MSESPSVEDLTAEEANRIIHSHRKVRYGTACWPCRQRKVKCDNKSPCENCVKREHAQLCSYKPRKASASSAKKSTLKSSCDSTATLTLTAQKRAHSPDDQESSGRSQSNEARDELRAYEPDMAESRYLGQNSIPALLREQARPPATPSEAAHDGDNVDSIRQEMRSILGLDNSAPFPLMSSRHLSRLTHDISSELPSDREVMKLFRTYKEIPQPFWGFVIDIGALESKLMVYLEERSKNAKASTKTTRPVSASWLAVLFAVLAVGSQYHDSSYQVRTRDSQRYMQIAFHFLRVSNFLLRPNFESIQALLMVSFVLLNDMKAEASWALLGLTCRLAQSLGLHREQTADRGDVADAEHKDAIRRKLWWTCVWHDTLTSLSFDRSPVTNIPSCQIPDTPAAGWGYVEAMYHLCEIICRRLNPDDVARASYARILENCRDVEMIRLKVSPYLRDKETCRSAMDRLQYFAVRLHTSFVISVCCRPALRRSNEGPGNKLTLVQKKALADRCKDHLTETVRMFLAMHQLSVIPTRSWAFTYHGLSSAVLLGIMAETNNDPEVRQLQGDLIAALSATAAKERTSSPAPHIAKTDRDIELSGPLSRALTALKNIYDHGHVMGSGVKAESSSSGPASGARTPLAVVQLAGLAPAAMSPLLVPGQAQPPPLDAHRNAALAMAEMQAQNCNGLQDFSAMTSFGGSVQQAAVGLSDLPPGVDPSMFMSPMDLYDQIFWELPDPYQPGVDAMNFDFIAQPPPGQPQGQYYF